MEIALGVWLVKAVLILYSVLSVAVIVERALSLRRVRLAEDATFAALRSRLARGDDAMTASGAAAPCGEIVQAAHAARDWSAARRDEAVEQAIAVQDAALRANLPILATVAATAPYIGLFGTVLGILDAFARIAATGQTGARAVSGSISEALIATALGLGVAIPAVVAYNYFTGRAAALSLTIETHGLHLAALREANDNGE